MKLDHLLALLAVGACSALLGRRALPWVAAALAASLALGSLAGAQPGLPALPDDPVVAVALLTLGIVMAAGQRALWPMAMLATLLLGTVLGLLHGMHAAVMGAPAGRAMGFAATAVSLQLLGALLALLLLKWPRGRLALQMLGSSVVVAGIALAVEASGPATGMQALS